MSRSRRPHLSLCTLLALATLAAIQVTIKAQAVIPAQPTAPVPKTIASAKADPPKPSKAGTSTSDIPDRFDAMEAALQSQKAQLDEMQKVILEQQKTIQLLSSRLGMAEVKPTDAGGGAVAATAAAETPDEKQPQSVEDRLKKVEERVLKIGPFRLSGDFRLRADGIFRSAAPTIGGFAAVTHQQNVRARYRLRLNFDTDLSSKLSFHGQLATGPINNPLTNDQDFGSTVARHPFFINEAWIDYHPRKSIQLQAGRLQEAFADNSRFLFDDDVRFNGANEKYVFQFSEPPAKITSVELRAGQYIFSNPNVAIVTAGSPLAMAGDPIGSTGRSSNLFHQGVLVNQKYNEKWGGQFGSDIQFYRNPNQIQLASTANGVALIVQSLFRN